MRILKPDVTDMVAIGFTPQNLRILVILCRVGYPSGNPTNVETLKFETLQNVALEWLIEDH